MNARVRSLRRKLLAARRNGHWVRLRRKYEKGWCDAVLLDIGPELVLTLEAGPEGYGAFQVSFLADLRSVERPAYERFYRRALKLREIRRPRTPRAPLDSIESPLRWLQPRCDAVTLFRPLLHPGECRIGKLIEVGPRTIQLQDISPGARWSRFTKRLRVAHLRQVEWGGPYAESLLLVGGPPPPLDPELED